MRNIRFVSFQKSGLHLITQGLIKYYSKNPSKRIIFEHSDNICRVGELELCSIRHHCHRIPCTDKITNFQAFHDVHPTEGMVWKKGDDYFYILVYRNPIMSLVSMYGYGQGDHWEQFNEGYYRRGFLKEIVRWKEWIYKWVIGHQGIHVLKIEYTDFVNNAYNEFKEILEFIDPGRMINYKLLRRIINKGYVKKGSTGRREGICIQHSIKDFKHYGTMKTYLQLLEKKVEKELELLAIPKINWEE